MSDLYRFYGGTWACNRNVPDQPADVSTEFAEVSTIMDEVHQLCESLDSSGDIVADVMLRDMGGVIYGSNLKGRKALDLDKTLKICLAVFEGAGEVESSGRLVASLSIVRNKSHTRTLVAIQIGRVSEQTRGIRPQECRSLPWTYNSQPP